VGFFCFDIKKLLVHSVSVNNENLMLSYKRGQLTRKMRKQMAKNATQQMVAMGTFFKCKSLAKKGAEFWKKRSDCRFHQHLMRAFFVQKIIAQLFLVTFWLWQKDFGKKRLSYEKCARKMLMKLTPDCQLHQHFTNSFFVRKCFFRQNVTGEKLRKALSYKKHARKCWWNWLQIVDFVNILLQLLFTQIPKAQNDSQFINVFFALLGSACIKASSKMLMKSTPGVNFTNISTSSFYRHRSQKVQKIQLSCQSFLNFPDLLAKKLCVKCWLNWALVSISSTFYKPFFVLKCFE